MFTRTSPSPQPCSPFGRGEGVVSIWCGYQDAPITRGFSETALTLNHFFETFRAPGPSGFAYENIAISEINSPDRNRFIAGKRLCVSRAGGLSAATTSSHAATASSHSTTASSHAASTSSRGRRGSRGRGSATGADCGNGHGLSRSGFYLDWRMLGLERSLGVGTRPLGPPAASGRRLDAAPLRISQWCACLHPRRLEIVFRRNSATHSSAEAQTMPSALEWDFLSTHYGESITPQAKELIGRWRGPCRAVLPGM